MSRIIEHDGVTIAMNYTARYASLPNVRSNQVTGRAYFRQTRMRHVLAVMGVIRPRAHDASPGVTPGKVGVTPREKIVRLCVRPRRLECRTK